MAVTTRCCNLHPGSAIVCPLTSYDGEATTLESHETSMTLVMPGPWGYPVPYHDKRYVAPGTVLTVWLTVPAPSKYKMTAWGEPSGGVISKWSSPTPPQSAFEAAPTAHPGKVGPVWWTER